MIAICDAANAFNASIDSNPDLSQKSVVRFESCIGGTKTVLDDGQTVLINVPNDNDIVLDLASM
jgi:hypothetical protein